MYLPSNSYATVEQLAAQPQVYSHLSTSDARVRVPTDWGMPEGRATYHTLGKGVQPQATLMESIRHFEEEDQVV